MTKKAISFDLTLPVRDANIPAYLWLYNSIRTQILEGRLRPGARLSATRDLAVRYRLSRGTIVNAFEQLKAEGYVEGTVGAGTFVSEVIPEDMLKVRRAACARPLIATKQRRHISKYAKRVKLMPGYENRIPQAFRANIPALDFFPTTLWAQIAGRRLRNVSTSKLLTCELMGHRPLREVVSEYLNTSRGVNCTPDQLAIVSGMQEALYLAARMFLDPGDRVLIEDPGYFGAAGVFAAIGAKISPVPVDDEGIRLGDAGWHGVRLIYVTPAHQFPSGVLMTLSRRLALLDAARKHGAMIFEDDYDSEYRYSGRPLPALQGIDCTGQVLYAGSFSKVLFPSLRLGYMVVPPDLVERLMAIKSISTQHAPMLEQLILCDFISEGHFGRHIRRMREIYAERLSVLLEESSRRLGGLLEISPIEAGLQTVGWLPKGVKGIAVARAAKERGIEVVPLRHYSLKPLKRDGLQLGFAAIAPQQIRQGVRELAIALEKVVPAMTS